MADVFWFYRSTNPATNSDRILCICRPEVEGEQADYKVWKGFDLFSLADWPDDIPARFTYMQTETLANPTPPQLTIDNRPLVMDNWVEFDPLAFTARYRYFTWFVENELRFTPAGLNAEYADIDELVDLAAIRGYLKRMLAVLAYARIATQELGAATFPELESS